MVMVPDFTARGRLGFPEGETKGRQLLAVAMEGKFTSYFAGKPSPLAEAKKEDEPTDAATTTGEAQSGTDAASDARPEPNISGVIERSVDSARLIVLASNSFLSDDVLDLVSGADRSQYLTPITFAENIVDWSLEDRGLLELRSRSGQFARTLEPLDRERQMVWEYVNYALALAGVGVVFGVRRYTQQRAAHRYAQVLQIQGA